MHFVLRKTCTRDRLTLIPMNQIRRLIFWIAVLFPFQIDAFTLITFDVDGTLLKGSGEAMEASAHSKAYSHAVSTVLNNGKPIIPVSEALRIELYHGSTDGLILLRLAKATLNMDARDHLEELFSCMYTFINTMEDDEVVKHISPLPGVLEKLQELSGMKDRVMCGLVTGNVEGIARRKMKAIGIFQIGALAPPASSQKVWKGTEDIGFLGGFGSDYCSGDIADLKRNYMDRGEQIAIAAQRCREILNEQNENKKLRRVVHVGDAPSDVLAAKWFSEQQMKDEKDPLCVGMVAVATGSYSAQELRELAGETIPGVWEPVVLEKGMGDPNFLEACEVDMN